MRCYNELVDTDLFDFNEMRWICALHLARRLEHISELVIYLVVNKQVQVIRVSAR